MNYAEKFAFAKELVQSTFATWGEQATNEEFGSVEDWTFHLFPTTDLKGALGTCFYTRRIIALSIEFILYSDLDAIRDTILHECAHALCGIEISPTGRTMHHGKGWKAWARRVGACSDATKDVSSNKEYLASVSGIKTSSSINKKWVVVYDNKETLEVVSTCQRRLKDMHLREMDGRPETFENLWLVESVHWEALGGCRKQLINNEKLVR